MQTKTKLSLLILLLFIIFTLTVKAWVEPSDTQNIVSPLNSGATGQSKLGSLILNLGGAAVGLIVDKGFVGIGTTAPKGVLDVTSTNSAFLPPRMTTAQRDGISSPQIGMMIYNTEMDDINVYKTTGWQKVGGDSTPAGTIAYFDLTTCPTGWSEVPSAKGRYLVGTQNSANKNLTVGQALGDGENRAIGQHNHSAWQDSHQHATYYEYNGGTTDGDNVVYAWWGWPHFLYGSSHGGGWTGSDWRQPGVYTSNAGSVAGTNAPYVEFLVCKKN